MFNFNFGQHAIQSAGSNFAFASDLSDSGIQPRIDDLVLKNAKLPIDAPVRDDPIKLPTPDYSTGDVNFAFPVRSTSNVYLNTEAGGVSAFPSPDPVGYYDSNHAGGGFYSLDFDVNSGKADVVAAKGGTVVRVNTSSANNGPVVTIYHGDGFFSEYREFTIDPSLASLLGTTITKGQKLGTLNALTGEHLHFQIKHNNDNDPNNYGTGLSSFSDPSFYGLTAGGTAFTPTVPIANSFVLNRDSTQLVTINGATGQPKPNQTRIIGVEPPAAPIQTASVGDFSSLPGFTTSDTGNVTTGGGLLGLHTGSPVWAAALVPVELPSDSVSFDVDFTSAGGSEGLLSIYWDGNLIGTVDERFADAGVATYTFDLGGVFNPDLYTLAFRLDPFTGVQSSADISNINVSVVPEPSSVAAGCGFALLLACFRWHRRFA